MGHEIGFQFEFSQQLEFSQ